MLAIPTVVGLSLFIFAIMRLMPGDVTSIILGNWATPESVAAVRQKLGLDRPLYVQYGEFLWRAVRLDVRSLTTDRPLTFFLRVALPLTLNLAFLTVLITLLVGVPAGILAAKRQNRWPDYIARIVTISGLCLPTFWTGMMVLLLLVLVFNWVPQREYISFFQNPLGNLRQMIWPALVLSFPQVALIARMTRSGMLEVLRQDYVRTAHAKGLLEQTVTWRHALPNALIPVVTLAGIQLAHLVNGAVVVEMVFNMPGVGGLLISAIESRDYPIIEGLVTLAGLLVILTNLTVDILYGYLDPRIRYR